MKQNITKINYFLIVFIVFILIAVVYFITRPSNFSQPISNNYPSPTKIQNANRTYRSKTLRLSITAPNKFTVKDEGIRVLFSNPEGVIIVSRNGTQFESLDDYLKDFDIKHKAKVNKENKLLIDNYPSSSRIITYPGSTSTGDKIYFIFLNNAVYHIFTSSPALFGDLDKIAQSFKHTP